MLTEQLQRREFSGFVPLEFFEKSDAPVGKRRRMRGIATIETPDRQEEIVFQKGLDFSPAREFGALNDNHEKGMANVIGKPEEILFFAKGEKLPNGKIAKANCHWVEGFFLEDAHSTRVWEKAIELQKIGQPPGLSIEGAVLYRTGPNNKIIAKAVVQNIAVTHCPVNPDTTLEAVLAKSMTAIIASQTTEEPDVERVTTSGIRVDGVSGLDLGPGSDVSSKALTVGYGVDAGAKSGEGAGAILAPQSLERRMLTKSQALELAIERYPNLRGATASRLADIAFAIATHIDERTTG